MARIQTLKALLEQELGVATYERETAAQAGVAASQLMRSSPNRIAWILFNLSANVLYINPLTVPSATRGLRLAANGGFVSMFYREDFTLPTRDWQIVASAAGSDYYLLEVFLMGGKGERP